MRYFKLPAALRALAPNRQGAALTEFAIAAPVMLMLYLVAFILSDAVSCNRKVTVATREITDVTSRFVAVQGTDLAAVLGAAARIMSPYPADAAHATIRLSEVQVASATQGTVIWSCVNTGASGLTPGSSVTLPTNMVSSTMIPDNSVTPARAGAYFIMGEVTYTYTPVFAFNGVGTMTFADRIYLAPRAVNNIPLTGGCPSTVS